MISARAHLVEITRAATDPALTARHAATMARVAQDRLARLEDVLAELPDVAAIKKKIGAKDATPRVSTADPDARVMKMPDGGFRPAFNVQLATSTDAARAMIGGKTETLAIPDLTAVPVSDPGIASSKAPIEHHAETNELWLHHHRLPRASRRANLWCYHRGLASTSRLALAERAW